MKSTIQREALMARLDQIDSADPRQSDPSLQAERALIIMELTNVTELNTSRLPPSPITR